MKTKLKYFKNYLDTDCKFQFDVSDIQNNAPKEHRVQVLRCGNMNLALKHGKLYLRPLSGLTKEMDFTNSDGSTYKSYPMQEFYIMYGAGSGSKKQFEEYYYNNIVYTPYDSLSYQTVSKLFEWHFDVFWLIEKGLAIDYNEITKPINPKQTK